MELYDTTVFVQEPLGLNCHLLGLDEYEKTSYPISIRIDGELGDAFPHPCISIHMNEIAFIQFKNSVLSAFRQYEDSKR